MSPPTATTERHPLTLRFVDSAVEADFQAELARQRRRELQLGAVVLVGLYAAFGVVDVRFYPDSAQTLLALRGAVIALLVLALPFVLLERYRALFERRLQEILLYLGVVATGGVMAIGAFLHRDMTPSQALIGAAGEMTALSFMYGFTQLRFSFAALLGLLATLEGFVYIATVLGPTSLVMAPIVLFGIALNAGGLFVVRTLEQLARDDYVARRAIDREHARSEALLGNALPSDVVAALRDRVDRQLGEHAALAQRHEEVTVLVSDLVGFTPLSERLGEHELARWLDGLYRRFDELGARHGVDKLKTLGDAWIAASGAPVPHADHASRVAGLARDMLEAMREHSAQTGTDVAIRVGVHTGAAIGGVVGRARYAYDLWGDAVDGAKTMEAGSAPGRVRISEETQRQLGDAYPVELDRGPSGELRRWLR